MRLKRGDLYVYDIHGPTLDGWIACVSQTGCKLLLTPEDLRWLCTIAGPAFLNELGKEATNGDD
jgi:hypothetical protein